MSSQIIYFSVCMDPSEGVVFEKTFSALSGDVTAFRRAQYEQQLLTQLNFDYLVIPDAISLEPELKQARLIFKVPSARVFQNSDKTLSTILSFLVQLFQAVDGIHRKGLVVSGLHPDCIFWDQAGQLKLFNRLLFHTMDLPIADQEHDLYLTHCPYAAPEQIGQLPDSVLDHRTDYYALGVICYEWLTGQPLRYGEHYTPQFEFESLDRALQDIITKLTHRLPQHRYQSIQGICADLNTCMTQLNSTGCIRYFLPGTQDCLDRIVFKKQLYGRDADLLQLKSTYQTVLQSGRSQFVMIGGEPGVGKTALVRSFLDSVSRSDDRTMVVQGKADQFLNVPYHAGMQVIRQLLKYVNMSFAGVNWPVLISQSLYPNGRLLSDLLPEMMPFFETHPELKSADPTLEKQRLIRMIHDYFTVFSDQGVAIVVFMDDLQWVDASTLDVMRHFMEFPDGLFFVIGSYRSNELKQNQPLCQLLESGQVHPWFCQRNLRELLASDVGEFVDDLVRPNLQDSSELAQEVFKRTYGNPLYLRQFFLDSWDQGSVGFDVHRQVWHWHLDAIRQASLHGTIADVVVRRVALLPSDTQDVLKVAALMGYQFALADVSAVLDRDAVNVALSLWRAVHEDFVMVQNCDLMPGMLRTALLSEDAYYVFLHDRIQQACQALISGEELPRLHVRIARTLRAESDRLFDVVNHYRAGSVCLVHETERQEVAHLAFAAGEKAYGSSAFESAYAYFLFARELMDERYWIDHYELMFRNQVHLAICAYLCGEFEAAVAYFEVAKSQAHSLEEIALVDRYKINLFVTNSDFKKAIEVGLALLKRFGVTVPEHPNWFQRFFAVCRLWPYFSKPLSYFTALPPIEDRRIAEIMKTVSQLLAPTYFSNQPLLNYMNTLTVVYSVRYGMSPYVAFGYLSFGLMLSEVYSAYSTALKMGRVGLSVLAHGEHPDVDAKLTYMFGGFLSRWGASYEESLSYLNQSYRLAVKYGDNNFLSYSTIVIAYVMLAKGDKLQDVLDYVDSSIVLIRKTCYQGMLYTVVLLRLFLLNLMGKSDAPMAFIGSDFDERIDVDALRPHVTAYGFYYTLKTQLYYLLGEYEAAYSHGYIAEQNLNLLYGLVTVQEHHFYMTLIRIRMINQVSGLLAKSRLFFSVLWGLRKLRKYCLAMPENFEHNYLLALGEFSRLRGKKQVAIHCFERAIDLGRRYGFKQVVAMGYELLWNLNPVYENKQLLKDTYLAYLEWGADFKLSQLKRQYPDVFL